MAEGRLTDTDIRLPLHRWLCDLHRACEDTSILHELRIPRPSARIDVAVVNGELCGFEIKSDVDSLVRLSRQVRAFNSIFDRVCIVTTERHIDEAQRVIPPWWGIIVPDIGSDPNGFRSLRPTLENPGTDVEAMLHMLWHRELLDILRNYGLGGFKRKRRQDSIDALLHSVSEADIKTEIRRILKVRRGHTIHSSPSSSP